MLQRCSASNATPPSRTVAAGDLSHALALLAGGADAAGGGASGGLPPALLRLLSPSAAMFSGVRPLGRGGFGTVMAAVGAWDGRAVALKRVPFRSALPPWAAAGALAAAHAPLLREARALAALSHAHVARYHAAWVEPRWERLAAALAAHVGTAADSGSTASGAQAARPTDANRRRRSTLRIRDASATSSEDDAATSSDDEDGQSQWSSESDATASGASFLALPPPAGAEGLSGDSSAGGSSFMSSSSASESSMSMSSSRASGLALALARPAAASRPWPYCLYISMELVPGPTLQRWLLARSDDPRCFAADAAGAALGALSEPAAAQARALAAQLAHGLAHMHGRGVLHRDLKPANVVLAPGAHRRRAAPGDADAAPPLRAVIVDLGLAAFAPGGGAEVDASEAAASSPDGFASPDSGLAAAAGHTGGVGTATYAAPEQASGRGYGPPADVYSLGLVIIELLCRFGTGMERAQALLAARAGQLPVQALERGAPGAAALIAAMLAPEPAARPTAAAVARSPALRRAVEAQQSGGDDVAALRAALAAKEKELRRMRAALERATFAA